MNNIIGQVSQVTFPFQLQESHDKKEDVHKRAKWTEEEDKQLIELYKQGLSWKEIVAQFPKRTERSCMRHWEELTKKNAKKQEWTEEDKDLIELYKQGLDWKDISIQLMSEKTSQQCRDHCTYLLQKRIKKNRNGQLPEIEQQRRKLVEQHQNSHKTGLLQLTEEEEQRIILKQRSLSWKQLGMSFPMQEIEQQSQKLIEQHQNGHMESRPKWTSIAWTEEKDEKFIELYKQGLDWKEIAARFPEKTSEQCRDHWRKGLQKRIEENGSGQLIEIERQRRQKLTEQHQNGHKMSHVQWTEEEEEQLITLKRNFFSWEQIERYFPNRTAEECSQYWSLVLEKKSLKKRERTTEESEGDHAIKRARTQLPSFVPTPSRLSQAGIPTGDFTQGETFTDLIELESVSDSLAFFDANFPKNSEDTF